MRLMKDLAMKQDIHPQRHLIKVIMTDGTEFETHSTWGKEGDEMKLLIDPKTHPAYTGQRKVLDQAGRMEKFNQRYRRKS